MSETRAARAAHLVHRHLGSWTCCTVSHRHMGNRWHEQSWIQTHVSWGQWLRMQHLLSLQLQSSRNFKCYHLQKVHLHLLFDCKSLKLTLLRKSVEQQESCTSATPPPVCSPLMHYRSSPGEIHLHYKAWTLLSTADVSTTCLTAGDRVLCFQSPAPTISSACSGQRPQEQVLGVPWGARALGHLVAAFLCFGPLLKCSDKITEWEGLASAWGRHREMLTTSLLPEALKAELPPHLKETLHIYWQRIRNTGSSRKAWLNKTVRGTTHTNAYIGSLYAII